MKLLIQNYVALKIASTRLLHVPGTTQTISYPENFNMSLTKQSGR